MTQRLSAASDAEIIICLWEDGSSRPEKWRLKRSFYLFEGFRVSPLWAAPRAKVFKPQSLIELRLLTVGFRDLLRFTAFTFGCFPLHHWQWSAAAPGPDGLFCAFVLGFSFLSSLRAAVQLQRFLLLFFCSYSTVQKERVESFWPQGGAT